MSAHSRESDHLEMDTDNETLNQLSTLVSGRLMPSHVSDDQWSGLIETSMTHGLGPMLFWSLKSSGFNPVSMDGGQAITESYYQSAVFEVLYEDSIRTITQALSSAGIPVILLKGAVLARTVYPQSGLRPIGDLDFLVPYAQVEAALDVLLNLGYKFDGKVIFRPATPDKMWDMIINQAVVLGWTGAVLRALQRTVDFFATPVPEMIFEQLAARRPAHEDPLLMFKKQMPGYRWGRVKE